MLDRFCDPEVNEEEHEAALHGILSRIADADYERSSIELGVMTMSSLENGAENASKIDALITVPELIGHLQKPLSSDDDKLRKRAILLLAQIFERRPNASLKPAAVHLLVVFLCNRLKDMPSLEPTLQTLQGLLTHHGDKMVSKYNDRIDILHALVTDISVPTCAQNIRSRTFKLLLQVLETLDKDTATGLPNADAWLEEVIAAGEGEKDPRCLLLFLQILKRCQVVFAVTMHQLTDLQQTLFDAVSCYFPITFTPPPDDVFGVTSSMLVEALHEVLCDTSCARLSIPFLVDQLEIADLNIGKRHALQALVYQTRTIGLRSSVRAGQKSQSQAQSQLSRLTTLLYDLCLETGKDLADVVDTALWAAKELSAIAELELHAELAREKKSDKSTESVPVTVESEALLLWRALPEDLVVRALKELQRSGLAGLKSRHASRLIFCVAKAGYTCCAAVRTRILPLLLSPLMAACERLGTTVRAAAQARALNTAPDTVSTAVQQERNAAAAAIGLTTQLLQCLPAYRETSSASDAAAEACFLDESTITTVAHALLAAIPEPPSSFASIVSSELPPLLTHDDRLQLAAVLGCLRELLQRAPSATAHRLDFCLMLVRLCVYSDNALGPVCIPDTQSEATPGGIGESDAVCRAAAGALQCLAAGGQHASCLQHLIAVAEVDPKRSTSAFTAIAYIVEGCRGTAVADCMTALMSVSQGDNVSLRSGALRAIERLLQPDKDADDSSNALRAQRAAKLIEPATVQRMLQITAAGGTHTNDSQQALLVLTQALLCVPVVQREPAAAAILAFSVETLSAFMVTNSAARAEGTSVQTHTWAEYWDRAELPIAVHACLPVSSTSVIGSGTALLAAEASVAALGALQSSSTIFQGDSNSLHQAVAVALYLITYAEKSGNTRCANAAGLLFGMLVHRLPRGSLLDALLWGVLRQFWTQCKAKHLCNAGPAPLMWAARAIFSRAEVMPTITSNNGSGNTGISWQQRLAATLLTVVTGKACADDPACLPPHMSESKPSTFGIVRANLEMAEAVIATVRVVCADKPAGWQAAQTALLWKQRLWQRMYPGLQTHAAMNTETRLRCLLTICAFAAHMPPALLTTYASELTAVTIEALLKITTIITPDLESDNSASCLSQCLQTLHVITASDVGLLGAHLNAVVPLLLQLSKSSPQAKNRALALSCLKDAGQLSHSLLHPHRSTVQRTLRKVFDDKKRVVRGLAADAVAAWQLAA